MATQKNIEIEEETKEADKEATSEEQEAKTRKQAYRKEQEKLDRKSIKAIDEWRIIDKSRMEESKKAVGVSSEVEFLQRALNHGLETGDMEMMQKALDRLKKAQEETGEPLESLKVSLEHPAYQVEAGEGLSAEDREKADVKSEVEQYHDLIQTAIKDYNNEPSEFKFFREVKLVEHAIKQLKRLKKEGILNQASREDKSDELSSEELTEAKEFAGVTDRKRGLQRAAAEALKTEDNELLLAATQELNRLPARQEDNEKLEWPRLRPGALLKTLDKETEGGSPDALPGEYMFSHPAYQNYDYEIRMIERIRYPEKALKKDKEKAGVREKDYYNRLNMLVDNLRESTRDIKAIDLELADKLVQEIKSERWLARAKDFSDLARHSEKNGFYKNASTDHLEAAYSYSQIKRYSDVAEAYWKAVEDYKKIDGLPEAERSQWIQEMEELAAKFEARYKK